MDEIENNYGYVGKNSRIGRKSEASREGEKKVSKKTPDKIIQIQENGI